MLSPLSLTRSALKVKNCEIDFDIRVFFNFEIRCDLMDVPASIYDIKTTARHFDTIDDILRPLSLAQSD